MEDSVGMHVRHSLEKLIHQHLDPHGLDVLSPSLDHFVDVAVHELEDEGESPTLLVVENLLELNDVRVRV